MRPRFKTAISLFFAYLSAACSDGSHTTVTVPTEFTLRFHASLGDRVQDVSCSTPMTELGTTKVEGELLDLAFFIHGLEFVRADGSTIPAELAESEWQSQNVALLDFQDRSDSCSGAAKPMNTSVTGRLASGDGITALRFTLGIPPHLNHVDPASVKAPLNAANMFWSWQGGYKAMRFDVSPAGGISRPGDPNFLGTNFFFHLGSTDCEGDPIAGETVRCGRVNQAEIRLDGFDLNTSEVVLDLEALVADLDLSTDLADTPGCMSSALDTECASYFRKLGLDLLSGSGAPDLMQEAFRLK